MQNPEAKNLQMGLVVLRVLLPPRIVLFGCTASAVGWSSVTSWLNEHISPFAHPRSEKKKRHFVILVFELIILLSRECCTRSDGISNSTRLTACWSTQLLETVALIPSWIGCRWLWDKLALVLLSNTDEEEGSGSSGAFISFSSLSVCFGSSEASGLTTLQWGLSPLCDCELLILNYLCLLGLGCSVAPSNA